MAAIPKAPPGTPVSIAGQVIAEKAASTKRGSAKNRVVTLPMMAEIVVRDHGLGIPPAQVLLLFNRFVRLPRDLASSVIGNGMGLYLCKVLAQAMGGNSWVESSGVAGEGSAFHVLLPLAPPPVPLPTAVERGRSS